MDFKGITWAGNIYQKFEAVCLEVEEVMYEDTVKYVENQVQKVGVSVKKFYSEVMQDLLPPSCVDSMKVGAGNLPLNSYAHTELNKPKPIMLDSLEELKKKEIKDEDIYDLAEEDSSLRVCNDANHLSPPSLRGLVENTYSDVCPTKSTKVGVYKRHIGIKRISRNNYPPEVTRHVTSLSGDRSCLLVRDMRSGCLMASDDMSVTTSSEFLVRHHPVEAVNVNTSISDASAASLASDKTLLAESVMQEKHDCENASRASDKILSAESRRQKKDGSQCPSSYHGLTTKPIDKFRKDGSLSHISSNIGSIACDDDLAIEEVISCYGDNFGMEIIDNEEAVEPREAILEPVENSKLEETCILVQGDKLHFVSQGTEKHKSYKKKICEALSSKLRSTRKQDQFVSQNKDVGVKNNAAVVIPALTMESDKRKFPVHDSFESDWELL